MRKMQEEAKSDSPSKSLLIRLGLLCCAAAVVGYAIRGRSSQLFGRSVYRGRGSRRTLALTFDDGPSGQTLELADYLANEGVQATFFLCGMNVLRFPGVARELRRLGHELGNHTVTHARLSPRVGWQLNLISPAQIYAELASAQRLIEADAGVRPVLFRAPYGLRWMGLDAAQKRLGLLGVMWTVIAHDWEWTAERVIGHVLRRVSPGGVICFHDGRETRIDPDLTTTLKSVRTLVPRLKEMGYGFETVSAILR